MAKVRSTVTLTALPWVTACGLALGAGCTGPTFSATPVDGGIDGSTGPKADAGATDSPRETSTRDGASEGATLPAVATLVTGLVDPKGIATGNTRLYWVSADDSSGDTNTGSLWTSRMDGSNAAPVVTGQNSPLDVLSDVTTLDLFWSVGTATLPPANGTQCLVMGATLQQGTAAAPVKCITSGAFTTKRIAITATDVAILAQPNQGNPSVGYTSRSAATEGYTSVTAQGAPADAIAASTASLYAGDANHVDAYNLAGLGTEQAVCNLASICGNSTVIDMVLDALGNLYWATMSGDVYLWTSANKSVALFATVKGTPVRMARDASYIYLTAMGAGTAGSVQAIAVTSGKVSVLAPDETTPFGIATDGTNLYWTAGAGTSGMIRSIKVP